MGAITDEDLALDRELDLLAKEQPPEFSDGVNENVLKKLPDNKDLLREYMDNYVPANSIFELEQQMFQAQELGADSVEVTPQLFRHFCGQDTGKNPNYEVGYFHYKSIKAYLAGKHEVASKRDGLTMEEKLFGTK